MGRAARHRDGGHKVTRASVSEVFEGDIEGEGAVEYLLFYLEGGDTPFVGYDRVTGRIGDRAGSFVLHLTGTDDGTAARATWSVVAGSGTGELAGLRGQGSSVASREMTVEYDLDYEVD